MTTQQTEFDELQDAFGITFGLGLDCEAQYERFLLYSACGGHEGDIAEADVHHLELTDKTIAKVA